MAVLAQQEHPVLGVGTSGFEALSPRLLSPDEVEAWPHNSVLQVAAEFGVVGLTLFGLMIGLALFRTLPYGNAGTALRLTFVFFLFNTLVSGDIMSDRETWGLMMLLLFLARPVTEAAAASAAISAGGRPVASATVAATPCAPSHRPVSTGPGLIVLTRMPKPPTSLDSALQKLLSAAFAAE